ncbi:hypothetical protein JV16_02945 [Anoxybacillus ayderensis]|uniref:ISLre2 family transposase n=2 Tax=Bacilli TaxID=91061 RepID=A0A0D0HQ06_9BACL|nr:ISLre2 family transposase [Anoxybacillus ayderensis]EPZ38271.1 transposase [Anoxybacillus ayderensis]KIP19913.1 hypothetical protein JV16_02945 [Anoxybacillus ayderensis]
MQDYTTDGVTLKDIEQSLFRHMQKEYGQLLQQLLEEIDHTLAEKRDKKRYALKDKRMIRMQTMFGEVKIKRNYYFDREKQEYICLLDAFLQFEGAHGISPLLEETAIHLAVTGSSYRQAAQSLEKLVGYACMSHETIRQLVVEAEAVEHREMEKKGRVFFIEADGLYVKRQRSRIKGKEEKIVTIHQGWEKNGKRVSLVNRRYYVHQTNEPIWEAVENFLIKQYGYDPLEDWVVINGDGASWITACRDYFGKRGCFQLDRFHVARDIRQWFRHHPRYRAIRKALASQDEEGLLRELTSAVGTLGDEEKERQLQAFVRRIEELPGCLRDYRIWLQEKGIETTNMRAMGSAEGTMHVFAKRSKNGRSWRDAGIDAMLRAMVAIKDTLPIRTRGGVICHVEEREETKRETIVKKAMKRIPPRVKEVIRDNIPYFRQSSGTPIYEALQALKGF